MKNYSQLDLQNKDKNSRNKNNKVIDNKNSKDSNRAEHWKPFTDNLRKLEDIKSSIKEQQETLKKKGKKLLSW